MTDFSVPLNYFTKRAKELQVGVRTRQPAAVERVRSIFIDAVNKTDREVAGDFGLMRAQHVVAVEHGFANWKAIADASGIEARLAITMAKHPELNDFGIGLLNGGRNLSTEEKIAKKAENRRVLRASAAAVERTVTWLRENVAPTRTIGPGHTSYDVKAIAEEDIGYISNGVMIAAGIIAQYPYKIVANSPDVPFGMSERSLTEIATRRRSPERVLKRFGPRAIEVLAKRGVQAFPVGRSGVDLAWLDDGDVRTLRIRTIETTPFIVRLFVDHFTMLISRKAAKALAIGGDHYAEARPRRPKGEISVLLDEVDAALEWALNYDARSGSQQQPPPFESQGFDGWSYIWSRRASQRSSARRKVSVAA